MLASNICFESYGNAKLSAVKVYLAAISTLVIVSCFVDFNLLEDRSINSVAVCTTLGN